MHKVLFLPKYMTAASCPSLSTTPIMSLLRPPSISYSANTVDCRLKATTHSSTLVSQLCLSPYLSVNHWRPWALIRHFQTEGLCQWLVLWLWMDSCQENSKTHTFPTRCVWWYQPYTLLVKRLRQPPSLPFLRLQEYGTACWDWRRQAQRRHFHYHGACQ